MKSLWKLENRSFTPYEPIRPLTSTHHTSSPPPWLLPSSRKKIFDFLYVCMCFSFFWALWVLSQLCYFYWCRCTGHLTWIAIYECSDHIEGLHEVCWREVIGSTWWYDGRGAYSTILQPACDSSRYGILLVYMVQSAIAWSLILFYHLYSYSVKRLKVAGWLCMVPLYAILFRHAVVVFEIDSLLKSRYTRDVPNPICHFCGEACHKFSLL